MKKKTKSTETNCQRIHYLTTICIRDRKISDEFNRCISSAFIHKNVL